MNNNKMKKYLFYFGYNGARFSGVEREKNYGDKDNSVAKYLEDGLSTLSPHNTATIYNSSNIAAGAHAICSTFHTELSLPQIKIYRWSGFKVPYTQEQRITFKMNRFFKEMCLDVRIHKTRVVPSHFDCRLLAVQRMYLHRLAHFPLSSYISNVNAQKQLPIPEVKSCQLISGDFNIKAIQSACEILKRKHAFGSFEKFARNDKDEILTRRMVNELKIVPGHPRFHPAYDKQYENLKFWDVFVSVSPFLGCSVHYMIGLLIGVGKGKIHLRDVEAIISDSSMYSKIKIAEPDGLYLLNVEYPPEAFSEETDEQNTEEAAKSVQK